MTAKRSHKHSRRRLASVLCTAFIPHFLAIPGCARPVIPDRITLTAVGDCQLLAPGLLPPADSDVMDRLASRVRLHAAINEVVSFQLLLAAPPGTDRRVAIAFSPLVSPAGHIPQENLRLFLPVAVHVKRSPGWLLRRWPQPPRLDRYYDALAPLDGPVLLPAASKVPVWVDVRVPFGTQPGTYKCQIIVTDETGRSSKLPLTLRVRPFALPADPEPVVLAPLSVRPFIALASARPTGRLAGPLTEFDPRREKVAARLIAAARLLRQHGLTPYVDDYRPVMKVNPSGSVRVHWDDYDYLVGPLLDGSAYDHALPPRFWPIPIDENFPDPDRFGGMGTSIFAQVFSEFLTQCAQHVNALGRPPPGTGLAGPAVLALLTSASPGPVAYEHYARLASLARQAVPALPTLTTFFPQDMSELGWYGYRPLRVPALVDIWAPPGRYFDPQALADVSRHAFSAWFRPDESRYTGSLMVEAPPIDARTMAFQAFAQNAAAVWLYPVNRWPHADAPARLDLVPDTLADPLILPPRDDAHVASLPSIRLKRIRRGIQDVAYLKLLEKHGRPELARILAKTLFRFGSTDAYGDHFADCRPFGWVEDSDMWELARTLAAEQIERAISRTPLSEPQAHTYELEWRRLQRTCRSLRVFVRGAALRFSSDPARPELLADLHVTVRNEKRDALMGTLLFGPVIPILGKRNAVAPSNDAFRAVSATIETLPPESSLARRATVLVPSLPASPNGHLSVPVSFDAGAGDQVRAHARLAYVVPVQLEGPIQVDGDLSDWPTAAGNSAGGFRLISSGPASDPERNLTDLPSQQTRVFVAADDHFLYFAFDCREERMDRLVVGRSNAVRYDGLIPVGEDFIEIVIDPTNARTTSTAAVYHLLIKANGVLLSDRGIACDPPTGELSPWISDARARVEHRADGWTAEICLPRNAFDPQTRNEPVWAINFARFEARLNEYSNWAGAKRHVYSPLSMGNLIWPQQNRGP